jgi:hypothetical protein
MLRWPRDTPRERLEAIYGELVGLVAPQGAISAEIEVTYGFT